MKKVSIALLFLCWFNLENNHCGCRRSGPSSSPVGSTQVYFSTAMDFLYSVLTGDYPRCVDRSFLKLKVVLLIQQQSNGTPLGLGKQSHFLTDKPLCLNITLQSLSHPLRRLWQIQRPCSATTHHSFVASWNTVATATSYLLDVSTASNFSSFVTGYSNIFFISTTSHIVIGLAANTTYYYRVTGSNTGGASLDSNVVTVLTAPAVPTAKANSVATFHPIHLVRIGQR